MSVFDGQSVNAAVTNAAYVSRTVDTSTTGKIDLNNADAASGTGVTNAQRSLNGQASFTGAAANGTYDQKPTWTNNNYGVSTDDLKTRVDSLDGALDSAESDIATINSQIGSQLPKWNKFTINYLDIAAAATTNTLVALTLPAAGVIHNIVLKHNAAFTGGSVSALTVDLGISGDTGRYINDYDIFIASSDTLFEALSLVEVFNFGATQDIDLVFNSTGDNLDQLTAGSLDVFFLLSSLGF
jgi:hypothetical protein